METLRFVDLFAGLGGFRVALERLGHECVFSSEIDEELRKAYAANFGEPMKQVGGDIAKARENVPDHDVLCAGFPCQPFSKSGFQHGRRERRGNLFRHIVHVLERRRPQYVILENVGNFEVHAGGRTWKMVQSELAGLGYSVRGTIHKATGGHGLISPHHLGFPQNRERFYVVASLGELPADPFPATSVPASTSLASIVEPPDGLTSQEVEETRLTQRQTDCINHWNRFLRLVPETEAIASFPIWGDELWEDYPYNPRTPWSHAARELVAMIGAHKLSTEMEKREILALLPSYAREERYGFPKWKIRFIERNREWLGKIRSHLPAEWIQRLREFPPSLRKFEWHCGAEERDLWQKVLQFRPSGLRAKRYTSTPALVAMTATQVPILGPERRFITRREGLRLQDLPDTFALPARRDAAFAALGNAVHAGVVEAIARRILPNRVAGANVARYASVKAPPVPVLSLPAPGVGAETPAFLKRLD